jgi:phage/plasmid-like protein (TIGR03299 family)
MSSALTITDRVPFEHQLGTDIRAARTVDEALTIAGLNWGLRDIPGDSVTLMGADGITIGSMPGRRFITRDDDNTILATVGSRYTTIDNAAAFEVADHAHALGAQFDAAGEIDHGRTTYMSMTIPEASTKIGGHDDVQYKVVLATSHAGEGAAVQSVTARRKVCTNGLTVGLPGTSQTWSIRHSASADQRLIEARTAMQGAMQYAKAFTAHAEALIASPMNTNEFDRFLAELDPRPDEARKTSVTRWENRRNTLMDLWGTAFTQEEGRHTRWAALNSVGEFLDWHKNTRGGDSARALSQFNDTNAATRQRAFRLLQAA